LILRICNALATIPNCHVEYFSPYPSRGRAPHQIVCLNIGDPLSIKKRPMVPKKWGGGLWLVGGMNIRKGRFGEYKDEVIFQQSLVRFHKEAQI